MRRLIITALAAIIVVAGSSILLRSRPSLGELSAGTAAMPSLLELHAAAGVHKLPIDDIEDQSLCFRRPRNAEEIADFTAAAVVPRFAPRSTSNRRANGAGGSARRVGVVATYEATRLSSKPR
jgi:hypothetical protein